MGDGERLMRDPSGSRWLQIACSICAALLLALVLAPQGASAPGTTRRLTQDLHLPTVAADGKVPSVTVLRLPQIKATGPRFVMGEMQVRYLVTPESDHWRRNVLIGLRIRCRDVATGREYLGPFSTTNWVWTDQRENAAPGRLPGPDVLVATRAVIDPEGASDEDPVTLSCRLVAHSAIPDRPQSEFGRPRLSIVGGGADSRTFLRTSAGEELGAQTWHVDDVQHLTPGMSKIVMRRRVTAGTNRRWLYAGTDLELTTCYVGGRSCPESFRGLKGQGGSTVQTQLVVQPLNSRRRRCASPITSPLQTTFISDDTHHQKISRSLWLRRPETRGRACWRRFDVKVMLTVVSGNPVRVEGANYTRGLWLQRRTRS